MHKTGQDRPCAACRALAQLVREAQVERLVGDEASEQEVSVVVEGVVRLVLAQPEQHLLAHVDVRDDTHHLLRVRVRLRLRVGVGFMLRDRVRMRARGRARGGARGRGRGGGGGGGGGGARWCEVTALTKVPSRCPSIQWAMRAMSLCSHLVRVGGGVGATPVRVRVHEGYSVL